MKKTVSAVIALLMILAAVCLPLSSCRAGGEKIMDYKGYGISEGMYQYWLASFKNNILLSFGSSDSPEFWATEVEPGVTAAEYYSDFIDTQIRNYCAAQYLFRYYGLKLDPEVKQGIKDDINEKIDYYGGRAELNEALAAIGINIDVLEDIYTVEEKHAAVVAYLYGEGGPLELTDEKVRQYYEENYSRMMYIVFFTTKPVYDESGKIVYTEDGVWKTEEMTEEELAAVRKKAEEVTAEAKAGTDDDFVALMAQSDFDILKNYPNGLFVSANEIDTYGVQMVTGLASMQPGDVISYEEDESVWIVRKLKLTDYASLSESDAYQLASLEQNAITADYADSFTNWNKDVTVNEEIKGKYDIVTIGANTNSSF